MHELAIAESVVSSVIERTDERQVSLVRLRVGRLAGVVPDALRFCFDLATAGTPLEGAVARDREEPAGRTAGPAPRTSRWRTPFLLCDCGSADVELLSGRELCVTSVEVA